MRVKSFLDIFRFWTRGCNDSSRHDFGSAAAAAGKVKKIVATRLQNKPIAQAYPNPASVGLFAMPSAPKPQIAVSPARMTGFTTPATS